MHFIRELNTFYITNACILDLTNGRRPAVHMITKLMIMSYQLPCNASVTAACIVQALICMCLTCVHNKATVVTKMHVKSICLGVQL